MAGVTKRVREPAVFFVVSYYANTQQNTPPITFYPLLNTLIAAEAQADAAILAAGGVGACVIQQIQAIVVYTPHVLTSA